MCALPVVGQVKSVGRQRAALLHYTCRGSPLDQTKTIYLNEITELLSDERKKMLVGFEIIARRKRGRERRRERMSWSRGNDRSVPRVTSEAISCQEAAEGRVTGGV